MRRGLAVLAGIVVVAAVGWLVVQRVMPGWYARLVYPLRYDEAIRTSARRNGLDPALIAAVIYRESHFRPATSSSMGAVGLMQVMPSTAEEIARSTGGKDFVIGDLSDPSVNVAYGSYYLRSLLDRYGGSTVAAVAAYNAGQGNVDDWVSAARARGQELRVSDIAFGETRDYVRDVLSLRSIYRRAYDQRLGPAY